MKLNIEIGNFLGGVEVTREQMNSIKSAVAKSMVMRAYDLCVEQAGYKLHNSYLAYTEALRIDKVSDYSYTLSLSNSKIANMIESGFNAFDMKSGFSKSSKVKYKKSGGWYLTIPLLFKTPGVSVHSTQPGQIMPRKIYDLIRSQPDKIYIKGDEEVSVLQGKSIPSKYGAKTKQVPKLPGELENKYDEYTHKSSIYAGLQRTKNLNTGSSSYNTFRRVSDNSDSKSWIHPGIEARNIMDDAMKLMNEGELATEILKKML